MAPTMNSTHCIVPVSLLVDFCELQKMLARTPNPIDSHLYSSITAEINHKVDETIVAFPNTCADVDRLAEQAYQTRKSNLERLQRKQQKREEKKKNKQRLAKADLMTPNDQVRAWLAKRESETQGRRPREEVEVEVNRKRVKVEVKEESS
ncbi:uncharacterized protein HMPREF1541_01288 [Cyphellophora europaea CBS 101466]|uniref:Uncharacterized protein n=1 Tax=Cyphellophora europaea (strain CBS 101466) TaxID=1220924 RepID=W2SGH0_CYPE1|nr:uncharacterized protein HMPREF1541_01288 [Cyphellophora europaea CBS 101466]ETN47098.1 hypothetical protein HMPREF1541_01288 [Cyphellophora europaea CBS 101466]